MHASHLHIYIERDRSIFKYIWNFLRSGKLSLHDGFRDLNLLAAEAYFYQIQKLVHKLRDYITEGNRKNVQIIEILEYSQ